MQHSFSNHKTRERDKNQALRNDIQEKIRRLALLLFAISIQYIARDFFTSEPRGASFRIASGTSEKVQLFVIKLIYMGGPSK